jgi:hypothetical protein
MKSTKNIWSKILLAQVIVLSFVTNFAAQAGAQVAVPAVAVDYSYRTVDFGAWNNADEKLVLNLFPGFRDVAPKNAGELVMFIAKSSMVIDKPAASIDLSKLQDLARMQKIKAKTVDLTLIKSHDLMPNKEKYLAYKNPKNGWCTGLNELCLDSAFVFEEQQKLFLSTVFFVLNKSDSDIRAQSQVRTFKAEQIQNAKELQRLTGVGTAPTAVIVEDLFWFSHIVEYGKIVGVVQPHPTNPNQSVLTGFTVFAVEKKWWDFGFQGVTLKDAFLGKRFNGTSGVSMGLPKLTQQMFTQLAKEL